jgi:hypothetical protein
MRHNGHLTQCVSTIDITRTIDSTIGCISTIGAHPPRLRGGSKHSVGVVIPAQCVASLRLLDSPLQWVGAVTSAMDQAEPKRLQVLNVVSHAMYDHASHDDGSSRSSGGLASMLYWMALLLRAVLHRRITIPVMPAQRVTGIEVQPLDVVLGIRAQACAKSATPKRTAPRSTPTAKSAPSHRAVAWHDRV